jgi:RNA polymerase sigma-70 factor (ECF subfamily)
VEVHVAEIDVPMPRSDHDDLLVRDELERAFRRLTTEQRAVLVLHHYLDLPDAAAAETLGVPVGTFKSRLHRATAALRSALEADARIPTLATESLA